MLKGGGGCFEIEVSFHAVLEVLAILKARERKRFPLFIRGGGGGVAKSLPCFERGAKKEADFRLGWAAF